MKTVQIRDGFTLAEVLITLGIIGVVAAMTMPTLINQTNGAQYKAAYKKALSAISQAVTLNVALDDIGFAEIGEGTNTLGTILNQRMNIVRTAESSYQGFPADSIETELCTNEDGSSVVECSTTNATPATMASTGDNVNLNTFLFFNDGSMFAYNNNDEHCTLDSNVSNRQLCLGVIDVNGEKGPNKVVQCDSRDDASEEACTVTRPTDIYPVVYYDQTILPASAAARAVLYGK